VGVAAAAAAVSGQTAHFTAALDPSRVIVELGGTIQWSAKGEIAKSGSVSAPEV
jgi:hypothetical protein